MKPLEAVSSSTDLNSDLCPFTRNDESKGVLKLFDNEYLHLLGSLVRATSHGAFDWRRVNPSLKFNNIS
jgi:hypothetical protein